VAERPPRSLVRPASRPTSDPLTLARRERPASTISANRRTLRVQDVATGARRTCQSTVRGPTQADLVHRGDESQVPGQGGLGPENRHRAPDSRSVRGRLRTTSAVLNSCVRQIGFASSAVACNIPELGTSAFQRVHCHRDSPTRSAARSPRRAPRDDEPRPSTLASRHPPPAPFSESSARLIGRITPRRRPTISRSRPCAHPVLATYLQPSSLRQGSMSRRDGVDVHRCKVRRMVGEARSYRTASGNPRPFSSPTRAMALGRPPKGTT